METSTLTKKQLDGFNAAAQSLKLYRRAELQNERGASLIGTLYVDPLPNDHVLKTVLRNNTTFLIGRKGTGKSTVFQRAQFTLQAERSVACAYIDIKTIYESAQANPTLLSKVSQISGALPEESLRKLLLYKTFSMKSLRESRTT